MQTAVPDFTSKLRTSKSWTMWSCSNCLLGVLFLMSFLPKWRRVTGTNYSLFVLPSYLNAIQTCCPHIFRYITAAVITNKKRQVLLKDLVRVIKHVSLDHPLPPFLLPPSPHSSSFSYLLVHPLHSSLHSSSHPSPFSLLQESYSYRDPITEFVECLYVNFDFDLAQQKLIECEKVGVWPYFVFWKM